MQPSNSKTQKENIMSFQDKTSDVIKNITLGTISAILLERIKIAGQIYEGNPPFDEFSFNIKDDQLTLITSANHKGTFFAKFDLAEGWGEKFYQFAIKQHIENNGYCYSNGDIFQIIGLEKRGDKSIIEFYIQETSDNNEYIDFDALIQFFIDGIANC